MPASESRAMAAALKKHDHQTVLSEVSSADHGLWRWVYDDDAVLDWMLAPADAPPPVSTLTPPADVEPGRSATETDSPFVPALIVSRALSLRLGNDALQTLVEGLPESLGETGIQGTLAAVEDRVEFDGRTFEVKFDDLSYQGRLHRAIVRGRGQGRMQLSFAVRDFKVDLGRIEVSDSRDGVVVGPVPIVIGHREPVWLDFDVEPVPSPAGGLKLRLLRVDFAIPNHNWFVKSPKQIKIRGDLFTDEIVKTAIVGGVYVRRETIEAQIVSAAPSILAEVERQVDFSPLSSLVGALWPLPVYSPRVQVRLEECSTDSDGLSLVFGCAVAGLDGDVTSGTAPRLVSASAPAAADMPTSTDLLGGISLEVIGHLSALVAGSDAARLYAADVPGRPFQELDDVAKVLAATGRAGQETSVRDVRSQLSLTEPFSLRSVAAGGSSGRMDSLRIAIDVPGLALEVSEQHKSDGLSQPDWTLLDRRDLSILQPIQLDLRTKDASPSRLGVRWGIDAQVQDRPAAGVPSSVAAADASELTKLFEQGWTRWASGQGETEFSVRDVAVGPAALRLDRLFWNGSHLTAAFRSAATILVNDTDRTVRYQIRGPHSRWSGEQTIRPHRRHVYRTGTPLSVRSAGSSSPGGQPLSLGTYDWTPAAPSEGEHWVRRATDELADSTADADSVVRP